MNVQLYAYENGTRYELDLYEEQPIKITLSAEEITDPTRVNSNFSRQFRIPATAANSKFFKYWYTSGVIDFDVTKKVTSEIHVDGIRYTTGQLRLVAAYDNGTSDRIDFEVVFLGETKTFSSQVGDGYMNSLDCTDTAHVLTLPWLENSWLEPWNATTSYVVGDYVWHSAAIYGDPTIGDSYVAVANNTNSEPSLTSSDWNRVTTTQRVPNPEPVRYILADRGYPYGDENNNGEVPQEAVPGANAVSAIAIDNSAGTGLPSSFQNAFTKSAHPLYLTQFTPIIQVKYLIDKIFEMTDYEYTDDSVFNEAFFKDLYVDGIATGFPFTPNGDGLSNATKLAESDPDVLVPIIFPTVNQNNANAYSATTGQYTIPVSGSYTFSAELEGYLEATSLQDPGIDLMIFRNGSQIAQDFQQGPDPFFFSFTGFNAVTYSGTFNAGDVVDVRINLYDARCFISSGTFACTSTPAQIAVNDLLKTDLKIIDWFRSILTKFRLVMVPTVADPNRFVVKPWKDYIATGQTFDWTYKLDQNKDIKMEPLFYEQDADITFSDQEDIDVTNKYQQDTFNQVYGLRQFVSGNELISGTREITTEFAPTPVSQAQGLFQIDSQFIIPKFYEQGDQIVVGHGHLRHDPIIPVQRLLFWNGLQPTTTNAGSQSNQQITWYYTDNTTTKNSNQAPLVTPSGFKRYPRASYLTDIPTVVGTLNLNWRIQFPYFSYPGAPGGIGQTGQDVYQRYWKTYIDNVYSPQARKMTAYFNLNSEDMRLLTFDDIIFIKDTYWRIQKVFDAPLGEQATIKVELIKLLDYVRPIETGVNNPADYSEEYDQSGGGAVLAVTQEQDDIWAAQQPSNDEPIP